VRRLPLQRVDGGDAGSKEYLDVVRFARAGLNLTGAT
jgi:hypothetical protein